jgi:hypothetical protein
MSHDFELNLLKIFHRAVTQNTSSEFQGGTAEGG